MSIESGMPASMLVVETVGSPQPLYHPNEMAWSLAFQARRFW